MGLPAQTEPDAGEITTAVIWGAAIRVKLVVVVPTQPTELVPLTVYTVETVGLTIICELVNAPGFHVKVFAPEAERVAFAPEQNVPVLLTLRVGLGLTLS